MSIFDSTLSLAVAAHPFQVAVMVLAVGSLLRESVGPELASRKGVVPGEPGEIAMTRKRSPRRQIRISAIALSLLLMGLAAMPAHATDPPGTLIAWEPLSPPLWPPDQTAQGFKLTYVTQDAHGDSAISTGEVFLPKGHAPAGGWPVISWAHGTSGLDDSCAPSVMGPAIPERDLPVLANWLAEGYAIVATDYAGLGTPGLPAYLNGYSEARNIVDMVKAGRSFAQANLPSDQQLARKWVTVGQSQGAGASVYAARHATELGGDVLDYRGAVGTGTPALVEKGLLIIGPKSPAAVLPAGITAYATYIFASLRSVHPELGMDDILTDTGRTALHLAETECLFALEESLQNVSIGDYFTRPLATLPNFSSTVDDYMAMPESGYDKPFFMGHGIVDTDVPFPVTAAYVATLEANRQPVTFKAYPTDHSGTLVQSQADTHPFVRALFADP